jgi:hypothetical protein
MGTGMSKASSTVRTRVKSWSTNCPQVYARLERSRSLTTSGWVSANRTLLLISRGLGREAPAGVSCPFSNAAYVERRRGVPAAPMSCGPAAGRWERKQSLPVVRIAEAPESRAEGLSLTSLAHKVFTVATACLCGGLPVGGPGVHTR